MFESYIVHQVTIDFIKRIQSKPTPSKLAWFTFAKILRETSSLLFSWQSIQVRGRRRRSRAPIFTNDNFFPLSYTCRKMTYFGRKTSVLGMGKLFHIEAVYSFFFSFRNRGHKERTKHRKSEMRRVKERVSKSENSSLERAVKEWRIAERNRGT